MIKYSPCYKCEKRHDLCHSTCEKYAKYQKALEAENEARKEHETTDFIVSNIIKRKKNKNEKNRT